MRALKYLILLLAIPVVVMAQEPSALFSKAKNAYDEGNYSAAIQDYQQILRQGIESASLHFNLGNAYFKSGEPGEAILHYEKAAKLAPRDQDIKYNLQVARARIQDQINPPPMSFVMKMYNGIKYWFSLNELAWTTALLALLTSLFFAGWWLLRSERLNRLAHSLFIFGTILLIFTTPLLISRTLEAHQEKYGIVLDPELKVYSGPQTLSTEVFVIHEGTKVQVEREQDNWYKIRLLDGKEGWVQDQSVGVI